LPSVRAVCAMRAHLVPLDGGPTIEIVKDLTLIGRRDECDVRLDHRSVSKLHCVIVKADGVLLVRDLGSTNGTRVKGERVRRAVLLPDDLISIASCKYRVHLGPDEPMAAADEHTQHLEPKEVAELLHKAKQPLADSSGEVPASPHQVNPLPDVYPEERPKG
jgi:predicted component of type VI protein secretion system